MQLAMADAKLLGLSEDYLKRLTVALDQPQGSEQLDFTEFHC